ncbi:MAG TPA: hypothetical protein VFA58_02170 [Chthoniobacterales bacterium]|nr:hypothetical protein [Chthoniobacterales bacterium]
MNWAKFFIAFIASFVFIFFFGFVWHGLLMKSAYMEIASHYRAHDDMVWASMLFGHAMMAFFLTWVVASFAGGGGLGTGLRLGLLLAFVFIGLHFIRFAVEPLTTTILLLGSIGDLLEIAIAGAIIGAIYKPSATTS